MQHRGAILLRHLQYKSFLVVGLGLVEVALKDSQVAKVGKHLPHRPRELQIAGELQRLRVIAGGGGIVAAKVVQISDISEDGLEVVAIPLLACDFLAAFELLQGAAVVANPNEALAQIAMILNGKKGRSLLLGELQSCFAVVGCIVEAVIPISKISETIQMRPPASVAVVSLPHPSIRAGNSLRL